MKSNIIMGISALLLIGIIIGVVIWKSGKNRKTATGPAPTKYSGYQEEIRIDNCLTYGVCPKPSCTEGDPTCNCLYSCYTSTGVPKYKFWIDCSKGSADTYECPPDTVPGPFFGYN
jgi:hypothetical protein